MRTLKQFTPVLLFTLLLSDPSARAEWTDLSRSLGELNIRSLAIHPMDPKILYAASDKRIFRSLDGGSEWKQIYSARSAKNRVHALYTFAGLQDSVFAATAEGLLYSNDRGKKWSSASKGLLKRSKAVFSLAFDTEEPSMIWMGTADGVVHLDLKAKGGAKPMGLVGHEVYALYKEGPLALASTDRGIYRMGPTKTWDRVFVNTHAHLESDETTDTNLEQFDIEEMLSTGLTYSGFIRMPQTKDIVTIAGTGLVSSKNSGLGWSMEGIPSLPVREIRSLAVSSVTFYTATDSGLFQWDPEANIFQDISNGMPSREIRAVAYSSYGDFLIVGTSQGIFKRAYPELHLVPGLEGPAALPADPKEILSRYDGEPTILEIQNAAIRYAEVQPEKIEKWRRSAALKGFLPRVSVDRDLSRDSNVDIDRGGTADPDTFIHGPEEESSDWSVGVSWDLGDLIWNNDQTSIDSRSRLMVELRDDILTQVTHLYYERRRLQVETALSRSQDLAVRIEKELKLQELTANIDALTGGYLSRHLKEAAQVSKRD
ncbi:MAG TPA: hypothetical protein VD883_02705 [Candidatus Omnitrophota bacterium]|nr:hypothetical protein [Candidatus Omnitrophota bacterium]